MLVRAAALRTVALALSLILCSVSPYQVLLAVSVCCYHSGCGQSVQRARRWVPRGPRVGPKLEAPNAPNASSVLSGAGCVGSHRRFCHHQHCGASDCQQTPGGSGAPGEGSSCTRRGFVSDLWVGWPTVGSGTPSLPSCCTGRRCHVVPTLVMLVHPLLRAATRSWASLRNSWSWHRLPLLLNALGWRRQAAAGSPWPSSQEPTRKLHAW